MGCAGRGSTAAAEQGAGSYCVGRCSVRRNSRQGTSSCGPPPSCRLGLCGPDLGTTRFCYAGGDAASGNVSGCADPRRHARFSTATHRSGSDRTSPIGFDPPGWQCGRNLGASSPTGSAPGRSPHRCRSGLRQDHGARSGERPSWCAPVGRSAGGGRGTTTRGEKHSGGGGRNTATRG